MPNTDYRCDKLLLLYGQAYDGAYLNNNSIEELIINSGGFGECFGNKLQSLKKVTFKEGAWGWISESFLWCDNLEVFVIEFKIESPERISEILCTTRNSKFKHVYCEMSVEEFYSLYDYDLYFPPTGNGVVLHCLNGNIDI